jgi:hypothetical protein
VSVEAVEAVLGAQPDEAGLVLYETGDAAVGEAVFWSQVFEANGIVLARDGEGEEQGIEGPEPTASSFPGRRHVLLIEF